MVKKHKHKWFFIEKYTVDTYMCDGDTYFVFGCECGACKEVKKFDIDEDE